MKGHLGGMCQHLEVYEKNQEEYLKRSYEVTNTLEGMIGEILAVSEWNPDLGALHEPRGSGGACAHSGGRAFGADGAETHAF